MAPQLFHSIFLLKRKYALFNLETDLKAQVRQTCFLGFATHLNIIPSQIPLAHSFFFFSLGGYLSPSLNEIGLQSPNIIVMRFNSLHLHEMGDHDLWFIFSIFQFINSSYTFLMLLSSIPYAWNKKSSIVWMERKTTCSLPGQKGLHRVLLFR